MKITLQVEKEDLEALVSGVRNQATGINSGLQKSRLEKLANQIGLSGELNDTIFNKVRAFLDPKTNAQITLTAHLLHDLSISSVWLKNSLVNPCNKAVKELIEELNPGKTAKAIKKSAAADCKTVQDIVDLIKETYESAA